MSGLDLDLVARFVKDYVWYGFLCSPDIVGKKQ